MASVTESRFCRGVLCARGVACCPRSTSDYGRTSPPIGTPCSTGTARRTRRSSSRSRRRRPSRSRCSSSGIIPSCTRSSGSSTGRIPPGGRRRDVQGKAVLVHTGWDVHWRTERYGTGHPFLTRAAAEQLVAAGAALVGIDSLNIDDAADGARPAHTLLLGAGIPIVEHLCGLRALPDDGFRFFAVPVKVRGMGSFPVRAFALVAA